jgi:hypothetical protein
MVGNHQLFHSDLSGELHDLVYGIHTIREVERVHMVIFVFGIEYFHFSPGTILTKRAGVNKKAKRYFVRRLPEKTAGRRNDSSRSCRNAQRERSGGTGGAISLPPPASQPSTVSY